MQFLSSDVGASVADFMGSLEVNRDFQPIEHLSVLEDDEVRECLGTGRCGWTENEDE